MHNTHDDKKCNHFYGDKYLTIPLRYSATGNIFLSEDEEDTTRGLDELSEIIYCCIFVKLSLCLIKHHAWKTYVGVEV
jgi:hypothetical protein